MPIQLQITLVILVVLAVAGVLTLVALLEKKRNVFNNHFIAKTAIFSAISIILYVIPIFKFTLPIFPPFLEIHLDEIPAMIAGFAYGPFSGGMVIVIKTLVKLPLTNTACVGELADLVYSVAFVIPAAIIYKKMRNFKGTIIALVAAMLCQIVTATFITTFLMLDFYSFMYNLPKAAILSMCQKVNPGVTDLTWPFLFLISLPFNALKDAMVIVVTALLYKRLHGLIDKLAARADRQK